MILSQSMSDLHTTMMRTMISTGGFETNSPSLSLERLTATCSRSGRSGPRLDISLRRNGLRFHQRFMNT